MESVFRAIKQALGLSQPEYRRASGGGWIKGELPDIKMTVNPQIQAAQRAVTAPQELPVQQEGGDFKFQMGLKDYQFTRPQIENLMKSKGSPLIGELDEFIKAGEKHGIDPRVLVSIANNESSLGKRYPTDSYNAYGYIVDKPPVSANASGAEKEQAIWQGLKNAGFTSMPHAIDALTGRFQRQPFEGYKKFYQDPTFSNLQEAYNATSAEREEQLRNFADLEKYYR